MVLAEAVPVMVEAVAPLEREVKRVEGFYG